MHILNDVIPTQSQFLTKFANLHDFSTKSFGIKIRRRDVCASRCLIDQRFRENYFACMTPFTAFAYGTEAEISRDL